MKITIEIKDKYIDAAVGMLYDYFNLKVTQDYILELLKKDMYLLGEVADGASGDTAARDMFVGAITENLEIPNWPCFGDDEQYVNEFYQKIANACENKDGIEFIKEK